MSNSFISKHDGRRMVCECVYCIMIQKRKKQQSEQFRLGSHGQARMQRRITKDFCLFAQIRDCHVNFQPPFRRMQILTFSHTTVVRAVAYTCTFIHHLGGSGSFICVRSDRFLAYEIIIILAGVAPLPLRSCVCI